MKNNTQHAAQLYSAILPFVKAFKAAVKTKTKDPHTIIVNTTHWLSWNDFERAEEAATAYQHDHNNLVSLIGRAETFISGFEDDDSQEGVKDLLIGLRAALVNNKGGAQ